MRYPIVNVPRHNFNPLRLGGLLDDYNQNVSDFKSMLSKQNQAAQKKYEQEHKGEEVYHPPAAPEAPPSQPPPEEPDIREARDFSREGAVGPEANLPPPMPPISVHAGDEVPPPFPLPPQMPGGHAPVVTGIPDRGWYPTALPPLPPEPETSACGPGYSRTVPGGPCVKNTPTEENYGYACYQCPDGSAKWTKTPGEGCTPTGSSEADCKPQPKPLPPPVYPWTMPGVMPNVTGATTTGAGIFAGGEALDAGAASFAGGGLLSGTVRLRRSHDFGTPALFRPIRMARRPW